MFGLAVARALVWLTNRGTIDSGKALLWACRRGMHSTVELLIEAGTDVHCRDQNNLTPLHLSCVGGHAAVAQRLIAAGADVNARADDGFLPLSFAIMFSRDVAVIEALVENQADVNGRSGPENITCLHEAALRGRAEAVSILLKSGADPNCTISNGTSPLHAVIIGMEPDSRGQFTRSGGVMECKHIDCARHLIGAEADVNAPAMNGFTPLHMAAISGNLPITKLLLRANADVSVRDSRFRKTPAEAAAESGHPALADLLDSGAENPRH